MHITKHHQRAASFAASSTSPHSTFRPALSSVHFNGHTAVATDTYRLIEITENDPDPIKPKSPSAPILIDARSLKSTKIKSKAVIKNDSNPLHLAEGDTVSFVHKSTAAPDEFPQYDMLFKQDTEYTEIDVDAKMFAELLAALGHLDTFKHKVTLRVPISPFKPIELSAAGDGHTARALLMPLSS